MEMSRQKHTIDSPSSSSSSSSLRNPNPNPSPPPNPPQTPNTHQTWWESITKARTRIQLLPTIIPSLPSSITSLSDSDRPARSLLESHTAYLTLRTTLSNTNVSGTGNDPVCQWLYETFQVNDSDLKLVVLAFVPVITGIYLTRVINPIYIYNDTRNEYIINDNVPINGSDPDPVNEDPVARNGSSPVKGGLVSSGGKKGEHSVSSIPILSGLVNNDSVERNGESSVSSVPVKGRRLFFDGNSSVSSIHVKGEFVPSGSFNGSTVSGCSEDGTVVSSRSRSVSFNNVQRSPGDSLVSGDTVLSKTGYGGSGSNVSSSAGNGHSESSDLVSGDGMLRKTGDDGSVCNVPRKGVLSKTGNGGYSETNGVVNGDGGLIKKGDGGTAMSGSSGVMMSLAGFESVILAIYASEYKSRGGKPVIVTMPDLSNPSLYHAPKVQKGKSRSGVLELRGKDGGVIVCPALEQQIGVKSTKRAFIVGVVLDSYYKVISEMPSWSKVEFCEFVTKWAGKNCPCRYEFDVENDSEMRDFEEGCEIEKEMSKLDIDEESKGGVSTRIPLPWELLQPVLRILGHCLLAPLIPQDVKDAASVAVRCLYARASHELVPQAILASRSLIQLDKRGRTAAKMEADAVSVSNANTPVKGKPQNFLVSKIF